MCAHGNSRGLDMRLAMQLVLLPAIFKTLLAHPKMLDALVEPVQIVWAVRNSRQDKLLNQFFARIFYALVRILAPAISLHRSSMFLLGSKALKAVKLYKNETDPGRVLSRWVFNRLSELRTQARQSGVSNGHCKASQTLADFFVGFSYSPSD
jgi:hypothetical protein